MTTSSIPIFKTPEGQARYYAAYDETLKLWQVPIETRQVPTRFGRTHLNLCGPQDAPPLVLIPGQAATSTMWYPNIAGLSRTRRIYVMDIVGDLGKSVCERRLTQPSDFTDWMTDLFNGLQLAQADVAGLSYGGFIALRWALSAPQRVRKVVAMAPASLLPIRKRFFVRMMAMLLPSFVLSAKAKQKLLLGVYTPRAAPLIKQILTTNDFQYNMYLPPVFTDAELRQITAPTLLMLGDHELIYDQKAAFARARQFIPNLETALIPGAGHALNFDQPDMVNARVLEFLG